MIWQEKSEKMFWPFYLIQQILKYGVLYTDMGILDLRHSRQVP